ncbi:hypothetical protein TEA_018082 [Camellia sinensis var. sinensis]|uniref:Uncharacterized protein n=1 Tax=Camellia sinensis var. sinensis TaxID=542762 RepID=A0A4S4E796_CAMSN|nr:hypothetical protein TEA_018082 [Camellia sinensis var. sinensis]
MCLGMSKECLCQTRLQMTKMKCLRFIGLFPLAIKVALQHYYSDSFSDSSNYVHNHGYHPLEDLKVRKRIRDTKLTPAEIARTTVEANSSALLIFPSTVHCEPHEHISWAEFQYVIDEYGDIFFEIFDAENILQDRGASNPVNVLIGMDITTYENRRVAAAEYNVLETGASDDMPFSDDYFEVEDNEMSDIPVEWGMPIDTASGVHPIYFAKCLTKVVNLEYAKKMDHPSNGVSIMGCLRPVFIDEELYLRRLFSGEDSDGYNSDWKDGEVWDFRTEGDGNCTSSTLYRLEIMRIELFSIYAIGLQDFQEAEPDVLVHSTPAIVERFGEKGTRCNFALKALCKKKGLYVESAIGLQDFQEAEPDVLVHSTPAIVERFGEKGTRCNFALKALCKKKGLYVEGANLIGVDSLGMDVRVFSGIEVRTHRFPFKVQATSEGAAEKQIHQLLFPPARRKKFRTHGDGLRDLDPF